MTINATSTASQAMNTASVTISLEHLAGALLMYGTIYLTCRVVDPILNFINRDNKYCDKDTHKIISGTTTLLAGMSIGVYVVRNYTQKTMEIATRILGANGMQGVGTVLMCCSAYMFFSEARKINSLSDGLKFFAQFGR